MTHRKTAMLAPDAMLAVSSMTCFRDAVERRGRERLKLLPGEMENCKNGNFENIFFFLIQSLDFEMKIFGTGKLKFLGEPHGWNPIGCKFTTLSL